MSEKFPQSQADLAEMNPNFSSENTGEYFNNPDFDKRIQNANALQSKNELLAEIYVGVVETLSQREAISFIDDVTIIPTEGPARFTVSGKKENGSYEPQISFSPENAEKYLGPREEGMLKRLAIDFGASYEDVRNNTELVQTFVLLNELGRADDFGQKYLPNKNGEDVVEDLKIAARNRSSDRMSEIAELPKEDEQGSLANFGIFPNESGQVNRSLVQGVTDAVYQEGRLNKSAYDFVKGCIMSPSPTIPPNIYSKFFAPPDATGDIGDRIRTGEKIEMNPEEIIIAGIRDGTYITVEKIAATEHNEQAPLGAEVGGFLRGYVEEGQRLELVNDVNDDEPQISTNNIKSVTRRMAQDESGVFRNIIEATTASGSIYEITVDPSKQPEIIQSNTEEMNRNLGLQNGTNITLLHRESDGGAITDSERSSTLIKEGEPLTFDTYQNGELVNRRGSFNTSVIGVERNWRTWMVAMDDGSKYDVVRE